jgi:hypothetical protein
MTSDSPEGEHGTVVDATAVSRMIALDAAPIDRSGASLDAGTGLLQHSRTGPRDTAKLAEAPNALPTGVR